MKRLVVDTDPGVDDAQAIIMACAHPGAQVEALTTVAGNVSVAQATRNALVLMDVLGRDIPVHAGCEDGIVARTPRRARSHGSDGLGDAGYPEPARRAATEHAALALARLASQAPGELTLVAIGPLTNLALATRLDPGLPGKYRELIVMGGAIYAKGNSWERAAEFNFYCDPEAAAVVFDRWPSVTLVSWETTLAHGLPPQLVDELAAGQSPRAEFFRRTRRTRFVQQESGDMVLSAPDALAMAIALEPGIVERAEQRYVEIELAGRLTRGQAVVDWYDLSGRQPNATLVHSVNRERYWDLLRRSFA
jgi:purine nucleosidase